MQIRLFARLLQRDPVRTICIEFFIIFFINVRDKIQKNIPPGGLCEAVRTDIVNI